MRPSHRMATALGISALLFAPLHAAFVDPATANPATAAPDRLVLNPTADPTTSQTITWRTKSSTGVAEYVGPDGEVHQQASQTSADAPLAGGSGRHLSATLEGLTPDTDYRYRVGDGEAWSQWHTFTTADDDQQAPWTFLYFGDAQTSLTEKWPISANLAWQTYPDAELAIHAGDLINDAHEDDQWRDWFAAHADATASRQVLTTPGNHELMFDLTLTQYRAHFEYPDNGPALHDDKAWFTDYQGVRFISLDGNSPLGSPLQTRWLDDVLSDNPMEWTVVTFHQPMFSASDGRDNIATRNAWLPILEKHGVDLVLQGHDHAYSRGHLAANQRGDGTVTGPTYVVSSAGGKFYDLSAADDNNWISNKAVRAAGFNQTGTFQAITVDGDTMTYRSVVAHKGDDSTAPGEPGSTLDAFTITRTEDGKELRPGLPTELAKVRTKAMYGAQVTVPTDVTARGLPLTGGEVELRLGGATIATAEAGQPITVPPRHLRVGTQHFTLRYTGGHGQQTTTATVRVKVTKARPTLQASVKRTAKKRGRATISLAGVKHKPAGRLLVRLPNGRLLGKTPVTKAGKQRVDLRRLPAKKVRLKVVHRGDPGSRKTVTWVTLARG